MKKILITTCFINIMIGNIVYSAITPTWLPSKRENCLTEKGIIPGIDFLKEAVCCVFDDNGTLLAKEKKDRSPRSCIDFLAKIHRGNGEAKYAGLAGQTRGPTYGEPTWEYWGLSDVHPTEARIPDVWRAAKDCKPHIEGYLAQCCLYNSAGKQVGAEVVQGSDQDEQKTKCMAKLKANPLADHMGLRLCYYTQTNPCPSWDWWYGDIWE